MNFDEQYDYGFIDGFKNKSAAKEDTQYGANAIVLVENDEEI